MFTGIVTDIGEVVEVTGSAERRLRIRTGYEIDSIVIGSSIACSGICLTVTDIGSDCNFKIKKKGTHTFIFGEGI